MTKEIVVHNFVMTMWIIVAVLNSYYFDYKSIIIWLATVSIVISSLRIIELNKEKKKNE